MTAIPANPQSFYPFIFQNIRLKEACWIDNEPYFTRRAIGEWLEYPNPRIAINNIIKRNPYIEDPRWSTVLKLSTVEGTREVTRDIPVYNPIGLQLIVFESRQPKARAYKILVAHLVYAFMKGDLKPPLDFDALRRQILCEEVLKLPTPYERGVGARYLAEKHGRARSTVYRWIERIRQGQGLERKPNAFKGRHKVVLPEDVEMITMIVEQEPRITVRQIRERMPYLACHPSTVSTIKRRIKERIKEHIKEQIRQRVIRRLEDAAAVNSIQNR